MVVSCSKHFPNASITLKFTTLNNVLPQTALPSILISMYHLTFVMLVAIFLTNRAQNIYYGNTPLLVSDCIVQAWSIPQVSSTSSSSTSEVNAATFIVVRVACFDHQCNVWRIVYEQSRQDWP